MALCIESKWLYVLIAKFVCVFTAIACFHETEDLVSMKCTLKDTYNTQHRLEQKKKEFSCIMMIVEQPTAQVIKKTWRKKSCISMCHHSGQ
jgi:hypothetical protein